MLIDWAAHGNNSWHPTTHMTQNNIPIPAPAWRNWLFCSHNFHYISYIRRRIRDVNRCFIACFVPSREFQKTSESHEGCRANHPGIPATCQDLRGFQESSWTKIECRATDVTTTTRSLVHVLDVRMQIGQLLPSAVRVPMSCGVHVRQLFLDGLIRLSPLGLAWGTCNLHWSSLSTVVL